MVKPLQKSPGPVSRFPWNLICSIGNSGPSKFVQMMTWVDLDLFYSKVKFGNLGFSIGKSENSGFFFRNNCSLWPESWNMEKTNWVHEGTCMWVCNVKVISWPWPKVIYIWKLKFAFLRNHWAIFNQMLFVSFWKHWNENLVTWPRWLPCPYLVKTLQNLLLLNQWTVFHKTWYVASRTPADHSLLKWCPWVDLDLFYCKVKFCNCSMWPESW